MPYTDTGKKVLRSMKKTYKTKKKVKQVFHAMINKGAKGTEEWHESDNSPIARHSRKKK